MAFYDLTKTEREKLSRKIELDILDGIISGEGNKIEKHFSDIDTYIRKAAYSAVDKIYNNNPELKKGIVVLLNSLFESGNNHIRQTVINAAGEIGITDFQVVEKLIEKGLTDGHHSIRNAVIG